MDTKEQVLTLASQVALQDQFPDLEEQLSQLTLPQLERVMVLMQELLEAKNWVGLGRLLNHAVKYVVTERLRLIGESRYYAPGGGDGYNVTLGAEGDHVCTCRQSGRCPHIMAAMILHGPIKAGV